LVDTCICALRTADLLVIVTDSERAYMYIQCCILTRSEGVAIGRPVSTYIDKDIMYAYTMVVKL